MSTDSHGEPEIEQLEQRVDQLETRVDEELAVEDESGKKVTLGSLLDIGLTRRQALAAIGLVAYGAAIPTAIVKATGTVEAQSSNAVTGIDQLGTSSDPIGAIYTDGLYQNTDHIDATSVGAEEFSNIKVISQGDDPVTKVDNAGVDGAVIWDPGTFVVSSSVTPQSGQTWFIGQGTRIEPGGDFPAIDFSGINGWTSGIIRVRDPNNNTTSVAGVRGDDFTRCKLAGFDVNGCYDGVKLLGSNNSLWNHIEYIISRENRNRQLHWEGDLHDNTVVNTFLEGITGSGGSEDGLYYDTPGSAEQNLVEANKFVVVESILNGRHGANFVGANEPEFFILHTDSNDGKGTWFQGATKQVRIRSLWSSSNLGRGVHLEGTSSTPLEEIQIGDCYTWNNDFHGVEAYYVNDLSIRSLITNNNFDGSGNGRGFYATGSVSGDIGYLRSYGNAQGVIGPGADDLSIQAERVSEGLNYSDFQAVNGFSEEAAGSGNAPSQTYRRGTVIENTDDSTIWIETSGGKVQL
ncbi:hypothetical protein [Natrinema sp. CGMCC1.2065]|uniref:hypothetical protein n=1 Tax=Natrinema sp. CGMCC1.2065 TaxID=3445767 RepID=UPI003F4A5282